MLMTPKNTTPSDAAKAICYCVQVGFVSIIPHAYEAMADDGVDELELERILATGDVAANRSHPDRWSVQAPCSVEVVVELESDPWTTVITVLYR